MPFRTFMHSLIGARPVNEDAMQVFVLGQEQFAVLCDGLGGYPDGKWAAQTFVDALQACITQHIPADDTAPEQALQGWLQLAWQAFCTQHTQQQRHPQAQTTCVVLWLSDSFTLVAHAGDSRAYLLDRQQVLWRSRDHNLYELGVLNGDIDPQQIPLAQGQNALLYRSVGSQKALKPAIHVLPALQAGQLALLCSDGAWQHLQDTDWQTLLTAQDVAAELTALLQSAVLRGGNKADNASAIVLLRA